MYKIKKNGNKWDVVDEEGEVEGSYATKQEAANKVKEEMAEESDKNMKEVKAMEERAEELGYCLIEEDDLIEEHKHLIEVLTNGTPEEREAEAKNQENELKEYESDNESKEDYD